MNDTIYGALIGCVTTLLGTAITLIYQYCKDYQNEQKLKEAVLEMFIISVSSYENSLRLYLLPTEWNSSFWNRNQLEIAKYFPEEAVEFERIIFNTSSFLREINRDSNLIKLATLKTTLLAAKSKMQQTCTRSLLHWLQGKLSKILRSFQET